MGYFSRTASYRRQTGSKLLTHKQRRRTQKKLAKDFKSTTFTANVGRYAF